MPSRKPASDLLARLRAVCLALPEAHEVEAWGAPTFRVRNKLFAMYAAEGNHHGSGRPGVWLKAARGNQAFMIAHAPNRFFVPPYVGPSGWVGVWLDGAADWEELRELVTDAWRLTAPKRLAATVGDAVTTPPKKAPVAKKKTATNTARKTTATKTAAKKSVAKKAPAKKAGAKRPARGRKRA